MLTQFLLKLREGDLVLIKDHTGPFSLITWAITELSPLKETKLKFVKLKVETPCGYT